jgi:hypothetical protein
MMISIDKLVQVLDEKKTHDTRALDALWIRFSEEQTKKTVEYHTSDGNRIVHVYLDASGSLSGLEIFP